MLFPAGRQIRKLPLSLISQSMTGTGPIAVAAGPDAQRPLRPRNGPTASMAERPVPDWLPAIRCRWYFAATVSLRGRWLSLWIGSPWLTFIEHPLIPQAAFRHVTKGVQPTRSGPISGLVSKSEVRLPVDGSQPSTFSAALSAWGVPTPIFLRSIKPEIADLHSVRHR